MNVSVVIPARNEAGNIERCLARLDRQVAPGDEILVLDNGSTDRTAEVAAAFDSVEVIDAPDERFETDGHFRGLSMLRQFGAETASRPVVATTDADTLPPSDWIDAIKTHFESDPDLAVLWGVATDTNGVPVRDLTGKYLTFLGGVSGCNTAFRRSAFDDLTKGYVGWPMFEDVALVSRLARTGKAVHDTSMEMQTDLDRRRYQTIPLLVASGLGIGAGTLLPGGVGLFSAGTGIGLAGTELFYENAPETPLHHDQLGMGLIIVGMLVGQPLGFGAAGVGSGMLAHHLLTEGTSAVPTDLFQNTDEVCSLEPGSPDLDCKPPLRTDRATRILAAATSGAVAAKLISFAR